MSELGRLLADLSPQQLEILQRRLGPAAPGAVIERRSRDSNRFPLSVTQQRFWLFEQLRPGDIAYNVQVGLGLHGPLDAGALAGSLARVVARHEILRTCYRGLGEEAVQVVLPRQAPAMPLLDLGRLPAAGQSAELARLVRRDVRRPFDLRQGPVLRATLVRLAPEHHLLVVCQHHIATDAWSAGVLLREVAALYAARRAGRPGFGVLPELPCQYVDFAAWQQRRLATPQVQAELEYWRRQLAGLVVPELPADRPRRQHSPAAEDVAASRDRGGRYPLAVPRPVVDALRAVPGAAGEARPTLFMALLAALGALLSRLTGERDVAVGSAIANRRPRQLEALIGPFLNTLVLRLDTGGDPSFGELVARAQRVAMAAYGHQEVPFEQLLAELQPPGEPGGAARALWRR